MRVRMKINIGGYRNGEPWPRIGECIDLPDGEARDLIHNGYAEEAPDADDAAPAPAEDDVQAEAGDDAGTETPADDDAATVEVTVDLSGTDFGAPAEVATKVAEAVKGKRAR